MTAPDDIARAVVATIAETFGVDPAAIGRDTVPADVDGWDSLAHTMLMIRLEKRLGRVIGERIATMAGSVGVLIDLLAADGTA
ncbi:MAG: acyl carrier protein [Alphaproteobacteria bacterium]